MDTPVVIIFFNRIAPLQKLVARLAEVRPPKVYLISDGARASKENENILVDECRAFMQTLPWECEVRRNFSNLNMGCRRRVISGLNWVFEQEDRAIILEDDCIPELQFFPFIEAALEKYADNRKVISIGGTNYGEKFSPKGADILFTKYPVSTGWGTWRRAWSLMDGDLSGLSDAKRTHQLRKWLGGIRQELYWFHVLKNKPDSWAYRWSFTAFCNEMYCGISAVNLISNVGFDDPLATNTKVGVDVLGVPDSHPEWKFQNLLPDKVEDCVPFSRHIEDFRFSKSFKERFLWGIRKIRRFLMR